MYVIFKSHSSFLGKPPGLIESYVFLKLHCLKIAIFLVYFYINSIDLYMATLIYPSKESGFIYLLAK